MPGKDADDMSRLRRAFVVAAAALLLPVGSTAHAAELTAGCADDEGNGHNLAAWAYYDSNGAHHQWYEFRYLLWGEPAGNQSNVNIWVHQTGGMVWQFHSPDSLSSGITYSTSPSAPVNTFGPNAEWTTFQAIFDESWSRDSRCSSDTASI
jgi:hypothetical protein